MLCSPHITAAPVPVCVQQLTIGTIANLSTSVRVMFENTSTNLKTILEAASNGAGLLVVNVDTMNFMANCTYIVHVALPSDLGTYLDITIGSETENEIYVRFEDYRDQDFDSVGAAAYTLSVQA